MKAKTTNLDLILQAKEDLNGKWGISIVAFLVATLIMVAPIGILPHYRIDSYIWLIIAGAIVLGMAMFSLAILRKQEVRFVQIFDGFQHFFKATGLYLIVGVLFFTLPLTLASLLLHFPDVNIWLKVTGGVLLIATVIILYVTYAVPFYILADNPDMGIIEVLTKCRKMMRGYKLKFFGLMLWGLLFAILACLPLFLGVLFFVPIWNVAIAKFYEEIKSNTAIIEIAE